MLQLHQCSDGCSCSPPFSVLFGKAPPPEEAGVDCTLSLGTPSTRHSGSSQSIKSSSFCWDILSGSPKRSGAGGVTTPGAASLGGDPQLLARRCANCDTTSTPLWRNGPRGPKSLCNACGIRYKKEERRASQTPSSSSSSSSEKAAGYGYQQAAQQQHRGCYPAAGPATGAAISMSLAGDEDDGYLSWRVNVVPSAAQFQVSDSRARLLQYQ